MNKSYTLDDLLSKIELEIHQVSMSGSINKRVSEIIKKYKDQHKNHHIRFETFENDINAIKEKEN